MTPSLFAAGLEKLGSAKPCLIHEKDFFSSSHAVPTCHRNCGSLHVSEDTINLTVELQGATYYWLKTMMKSYLAMCSIAVASDQLWHEGNCYMNFLTVKLKHGVDYQITQNHRDGLSLISWSPKFYFTVQQLTDQQCTDLFPAS